MKLLPLLVLPFLPVHGLNEEFSKVTCGSTLKLAHPHTNTRLHSHQVTYGSGSRQQSITTTTVTDDPGSYFTVQGAFGETCVRGDVIKCNALLRLLHVSTKKYLHSHLHLSPLSNQQEVSAFFPSDGGDNWKVVCLEKGDGVWMRDKSVRLMHVDTKTFLSANALHKYGHPISGQLEVAGSQKTSKNEEWQAAEGIYFPDRSLGDN